MAEIECYLCNGGDRDVMVLGEDGSPQKIECPVCHGRGTVND